MIQLIFRLLPEGPQKVAGMALVDALQADPNSMAMLLTHANKIPNLIGEVQAGQKNVATAFMGWLGEYETLPISSAVRQKVADLIASIARAPETTNSALGPMLPVLRGMMGGQ